MFEVGARLGRYRITGEISRGGGAAVFSAEHVLIGRSVAIKLIDSPRAPRRQALEQLFSEARAANRFAHPNIIQITDLVDGGDDGPTFIVMELLRGETLGERIRRGPLQPLRAMEVGRQIAGAMQAAHEAGVLHRDLKPANVFLCRGDAPPRVKILDFGLAGLAPATLGGTPLYMAPEQAHLEAVDHRADIYSLGAVLYEAVTGQVVFDAATLSELLAAHGERAPLPPGRLQPLPSRLEALIMRCLEKSPRRRPQTMGEIADELAAIQRREQPSRRKAKGAPRRRRRLVELLAGGAAAVAVAAALASLGSVSLRQPAATGLAGALSAARGAPAAATERATYRLRVESRPPGALVSWRGERVGRTPMSIELDSRASGELVIERRGWIAVRRTVEVTGDATLQVELKRR